MGGWGVVCSGFDSWFAFSSRCGLQNGLIGEAFKLMQIAVPGGVSLAVI